MTELNIGSTLQSGKYEIIKVLGQGGFGITYLARHALLGTNFAIKEFFPSDYCNRDGATSHISVATQSNVDLVERLLTRFITEAQNIARLHHPGIIQIHDVFKDNGTAYYVMDFIEGESLDDMVKREGAISEQRAVDYVCKVGEALEFIHQRNMTHFDVKPANIMVRESDGEPILIDFGLSKQFNDQGHSHSTLLMGVSHGFSPIEQYFQDGITGFSPQTDVYALGATLYYLLTSRVPPEAPRLSGTTIEVPVTVSPAVAEVVKWSMLSDLNQRCPSACAFIDALKGESSLDLSRTVAVGAAANVYRQPAGGSTIPPQTPPKTDPVAPDPSGFTDYPETGVPRKSGLSGWLIALLIFIAVALIGVIVYLVMDNNSKKEDPYKIEESADMKSEVYDNRNVEEVAIAETTAGEEDFYQPEAEAEPVAESGQFGTFNINGNVKGYPIRMKITCVSTDSGCHVYGKYAYESTLSKYGSGDSSWFHFDGYGDYDGTNISWSEYTSGNPDYTGQFDGSFINGELDGIVYSNVDNAERCRMYAR